ncbi:hypothetical protein, partial [Ralstonia pseudosolanacearum]|uniref:hypothetical protein n=1 Tax=Ralstonia pseudosolanacearum TaxID=1310165 RepID=UPI003AACB893
MLTLLEGGSHMLATQDASAQEAIAGLARFVTGFSDDNYPFGSTLALHMATPLALAYFTAWQAWGKPMDSIHGAVAADLYGDHPICPARLVHALTAVLDQHEPLWRGTFSTRVKASATVIVCTSAL